MPPQSKETMNTTANPPASVTAGMQAYKVLPFPRPNPERPRPARPLESGKAGEPESGTKTIPIDVDARIVREQQMLESITQLLGHIDALRSRRQYSETECEELSNTLARAENLLFMAETHEPVAKAATPTEPYYASIAGKRVVVLPHDEPGLKVYATIKTTSKYESQGRVDHTDAKSPRIVFAVTLQSQKWQIEDGYVYRLEGSCGGQYRKEDVDLYLSNDGKEFVKV